MMRGRVADFSCFPRVLIRRLIRALPCALRFPSGLAVDPPAYPLAVFLGS